jgi:hypothetical protein
LMVCKIYCFNTTDYNGILVFFTSFALLKAH